MWAPSCRKLDILLQQKMQVRCLEKRILILSYCGEIHFQRDQQDIVKFLASLLCFSLFLPSQISCDGVQTFLKSYEKFLSSPQDRMLFRSNCKLIYMLVYITTNSYFCKDKITIRYGLRYLINCSAYKHTCLVFSTLLCLWAARITQCVQRFVMC